MTRKFRLDDVRNEIMGNSQIIRQYSITNVKGVSSDRTFWWMLCGCNKDCSCDSESGCNCFGYSGSSSDLPECRCDNYDSDCQYCVNI